MRVSPCGFYGQPIIFQGWALSFSVPLLRERPSRGILNTPGLIFGTHVSWHRERGFSANIGGGTLGASVFTPPSFRRCPSPKKLTVLEYGKTLVHRLPWCSVGKSRLNSESRPLWPETIPQKNLDTIRDCMVYFRRHAVEQGWHAGSASLHTRDSRCCRLLFRRNLDEPKFANQSSERPGFIN